MTIISEDYKYKLCYICLNNLGMSHDGIIDYIGFNGTDDVYKDLTTLSREEMISKIENTYSKKE